MLSDRAIRGSIRCTKTPEEFIVAGPGAHIYEGLDIEPFDPAYLNPASVDLTLSPVVRVMTWPIMALDVREIYAGHTDEYDLREIVPQPKIHPRLWGSKSPSQRKITLEPGDFFLGATNEVVTIPDTLIGRVEGKSSLGRLGLAVHITAGFIDPGFHGSITLEIANFNQVPIVLRPGMRIAQIAFETVHGTVDKPYGTVGHYQDQPAGRPVESRYRL